MVNVVLKCFLAILVHIPSLYLNGTERRRLGGLARKIFKILNIWIGLKFTSQSGLMSFYKTCSKKFGLNISLSIPIQRHKNTSAYDTQGVKNFNILPFVSSSPMRNMAEDPEK